MKIGRRQLERISRGDGHRRHVHRLRRVRRRQGGTDELGEGAHDAGEPGGGRACRPTSVRSRAERDRVSRARHDRRAERVSGAQGHPPAARHDRGPARRVLNRPPRSQGALRPALPEARTARAAPRRRRGRRAAALGRLGRDAARSGESRAAVRAHPRSERRGGRDLPSPRVRQSRARAPAARPPAGGVPRSVDHALARDRARVARIRTGVVGDVERVHRATGRGIPRDPRARARRPRRREPALCDAVERRHHKRAESARRADPDTPLGACRRHDRGRGARPCERPRRICSVSTWAERRSTSASSSTAGPRSRPRRSSRAYRS